MELIEHINNTLRHTFRGDWLTLVAYVFAAAVIQFRVKPLDQQIAGLRNKEEIGLLFTGYLFWLFLFQYQFLSSLKDWTLWSLAEPNPISSGILNSVIGPAMGIMLITFFEEFVWRGPLFEKVQSRWGMGGTLILWILQLSTLNLNRIQLLSPLVYSWLKLRTRSFAITWSLHSLERLLFYYAFTGSVSKQWVLNSLNEHNILLTFCTVSFSVAPLWMFFDIKQQLGSEKSTRQYSSSAAIEVE